MGHEKRREACETIYDDKAALWDILGPVHSVWRRSSRPRASRGILSCHSCCNSGVSMRTHGVTYPIRNVSLGDTMLRHAHMHRNMTYAPMLALVGGYLTGVT